MSLATIAIMYDVDYYFEFNFSLLFINNRVYKLYCNSTLFMYKLNRQINNLKTDKDLNIFPFFYLH